MRVEANAAMGNQRILNQLSRNRPAMTVAANSNATTCSAVIPKREAF